MYHHQVAAGNHENALPVGSFRVECIRRDGTCQVETSILSKQISVNLEFTSLKTSMG